MTDAEKFQSREREAASLAASPPRFPGAGLAVSIPRAGSGLFSPIKLTVGGDVTCQVSIPRAGSGLFSQ